MLILKLNLCDYEKLAVLKIRVHRATAKLEKNKGFYSIKGFTVSKNSVEQFCRRRFLKVLQTPTKFLHFSNFQCSAKMPVGGVSLQL